MLHTDHCQPFRNPLRIRTPLPPTDQGLQFLQGEYPNLIAVSRSGRQTRFSGLILAAELQSGRWNFIVFEFPMYAHWVLPDAAVAEGSTVATSVSVAVAVGAAVASDVAVASLVGLGESVWVGLGAAVASGVEVLLGALVADGFAVGLSVAVLLGWAVLVGVLVVACFTVALGAIVVVLVAVGLKVLDAQPLSNVANTRASATPNK